MSAQWRVPVTNNKATAVLRTCWTVRTVSRKRSTVHAPARTGIVQVIRCLRAVSRPPDQAWFLQKMGIVKGGKWFFLFFKSVCRRQQVIETMILFSLCLRRQTIYGWIKVLEKRWQQCHLPTKTRQQIGTGVEGHTVLVFPTAAVNILSRPLNLHSKNTLF